MSPFRKHASFPRLHGPNSLLILLIAVIFTGCASIRLPAFEIPRKIEVPHAHYIVVHKEGYPIDHSGDPTDWRPLTDDEFKREFLNQVLDGIDHHAIAAWEMGKIPNVMIFVHGGLNTYFGGLRRVESFLKAQHSGDVPTLSSYYPIFINWDSSLWSSLWDNVFVIDRGRRPRSFAEGAWNVATAPFTLAAQLGESLLFAPRALSFMVDNFDDSVRWTEENPHETDIDRTAIGIGYWLPLSPVRALTVPVIRGFGRPAWEMMKRRADLVMASNTDTPESLASRQGAGRTLLEALRARICRKGSTPPECKTGKETAWTVGTITGPIRIVLVGHSMGTLVLNRLLQSFPEVQFDHVIYLAAASSIDEVESSVFPYLCRPDGCPHRTRFWGMSLSNSNEAREIAFLDVYERGSLLVWVDNFFERVLTPTQRTFGRLLNYGDRYGLLDGNYRDPNSDSSRVCVGKFLGRGEEPTNHDDFSEPKILDRILKIVESRRCPGGQQFRFE